MANPLRVVIVEDQATIRRDLKDILARIPGVSIVAETGSVYEAKIILPATSPDLVFMDVMLSDGDCFEILEELAPLAFRVIFVTAYEQYAISAIKFGALDYLLKPLVTAEIVDAIGKLAAVPPDPLQVTAARTSFSASGRAKGKIALQSPGYWQMVAIEEILYVEGTTGSMFHVDGGEKVMTKKTLKEYEEILPVEEFIRVHQSYLVNFHHIVRYHKNGYLVLSNGHELPVSGRRKESVEAFLRNL